MIVGILGDANVFKVEKIQKLQTEARFCSEDQIDQTGQEDLILLNLNQEACFLEVENR